MRWQCGQTVCTGVAADKAVMDIQFASRPAIASCARTAELSMRLQLHAINATPHSRDARPPRGHNRRRASCAVSGLRFYCDVGPLYAYGPLSYQRQSRGTGDRGARRAPVSRRVPNVRRLGTAGHPRGALCPSGVGPGLLRAVVKTPIRSAASVGALGTC